MNRLDKLVAAVHMMNPFSDIGNIVLDDDMFTIRSVGETVLDTNKVMIYGWETGQSIELVSYFEELILSGVKLPPVNLIQISDDKYCLYHDNQIRIFKGSEDGGHHRVIAYQRANVPMPAILCENDTVRYDCVLLNPNSLVSDYMKYKMSVSRHMERTLQ